MVAVSGNLWLHHLLIGIIGILRSLTTRQTLPGRSSPHFSAWTLRSNRTVRVSSVASAWTGVEQVRGILPAQLPPCPLPSCLYTWQGLPTRHQQGPSLYHVHPSYITPNKLWVSKEAEKKQLIRRFKAQTSQIQCWFLIQEDDHCPFKYDCTYLHLLLTKAWSSLVLSGHRMCSWLL